MQISNHMALTLARQTSEPSQFSMMSMQTADSAGTFDRVGPEKISLIMQAKLRSEVSSTGKHNREKHVAWLWHLIAPNIILPRQILISTHETLLWHSWVRGVQVPLQQ